MIYLQLFGSADVRNDEGAKAHSILAHSKHIAFLAVVAAARHSTVRRDRVLGLLWPELDDARARNALSKAIHQCRRQLGETSIIGRSAEEIGLDSDRWSCDLWEFDDALTRQAFPEALAIFARGEFLAGLHITDAAAWEHWLDGERGRLHRRALDAAATLVDTHEQSGDLVGAIHWARRLCELHPIDERSTRRHMELLDRAGDRSGALRVFGEFVALVRREFETSPAPETQALADIIRQRSKAAATMPPNPAPQLVRIDVEAVADVAPVPTETNAFDHSTASPRSTDHLTKTWRMAPRIGVGVAAALLVLTGGLFLASRSRAPQSATAASASTILPEPAAEPIEQGGVEPAPMAADSIPATVQIPTRVLVAPFENHTGDTALAAVGELAADMLGAALSRAGVAEVIDSRTRIRQGVSIVSDDTAGSNDRLAGLARTTGVNAIVTGSYSVTNGSLRVIAQVRGLGGSSVSQRVFEEKGPVADPPEVLRNVERRLLGIFAVLRDRNAASATTSTTPLPTYGAYVEYVAGLRRWIADDYVTSTEHFARAYVMDSMFVSVVPYLVDGLEITGNRGRADSIVSALGKRRDLLAPFDVYLLDFTVAFYEGNRAAMYSAARRMVALAPHSADAHWSLGFAATTTNRYAEGLREFAKVDMEHGWQKDGMFQAINWQSTANHMLGRHREERSLVSGFRSRHPANYEACSYELRAMAVTESLDALEQRLTECSAPNTSAPAWWSTQTRMMVANELRRHGRPLASVQFASTAVAWYRDAARWDPTSAALRDGLATALLESESWAESLDYFVSEARKRPTNQPPRFAANAAIAAAHLGDTVVVGEMLGRLLAGTPLPIFHMQRARVFAHLGRLDAAVKELQQAVSKGLSPAELMHANFGLIPLAGHPGYEALMGERTP